MLFKELSKEKLIEAYFRAVELRLDDDFVFMLALAIQNRGLSHVIKGKERGTIPKLPVNND